MPRWAKFSLVTGGLLALLWLCGDNTPYYSTMAVWELRKAFPWVLMLLLILATFVPGLLLAAWRDDHGESATPGVLLTIGGFLVGGFLVIMWMFHTDYSQERTYASSAQVVTDPVPVLAGRAPYQVGQAQARPNLGDVAGDIASTTYLPQDERFGTLVNRRGWLAGYQTVLVQQIPLQGRGAVDQRCDFAGKADARISGWWDHNLGRMISEHRRWVRFNSDDVYAYCDGNTPMVVVPLKRQVGFWVVTERPAGVALYNGATGDLAFLADATGIPGPSYPLSLAAKQREDTPALGSFTDWFWDRSGWETSDDEVNSGNDTEFTLALADSKRPVYVTPLTGRGSATAISVVTVIPAQVRDDQLAPMKVHHLSPAWVSPKAIVDRIKADYQDIPNWQNINVYEVIPTGGNSWVATIGTGQNILYRATGTGDLKGDKPTCLQRADGTAIRCGSVANVGGNGPGTQYGPAGGGSGAQAGDLSSLSDAQLADLQQRLAGQIACRLNRTCAAAAPAASPTR